MILKICVENGEKEYSLWEKAEIIKEIKERKNVILSVYDNIGYVCDILDKNEGVYEVDEGFYSIKDKVLKRVLIDIMYNLEVFKKVG